MVPIWVKLFVCAMLGKRWDLGGLTCSCCLVAEKVKKKIGDWNFGLLWVFSDLVSVMKLKSLLNNVN